MKNIRQKVFETNSSSTHSISISSSSNGILDTIYPNSEGVICLRGGEFGWQWERFNDALTKANYCATDILYRPEDEQTTLYCMLEEVICEHTGAKKVIFTGSNKWEDRVNHSYIDHDSVGTSMEAFKNKETLKDFIFNFGSWIFLGNDNDYPPYDFYTVDDTFRHKYQLSIEGSDLIYKFYQHPSEDEVKTAIEYIMDRHPQNNWQKQKDGYRFKNSYELKNSFMSFNKNLIILFKYKENVINKIIDTKELKFSIDPITTSQN